MMTYNWAVICNITATNIVVLLAFARIGTTLHASFVTQVFVIVRCWGDMVYLLMSYMQNKNVAWLFCFIDTMTYSEFIFVLVHDITYVHA